MTTVNAYCSNLELHPANNEATRRLQPLIEGTERFDFVYTVADPTSNQGQVSSNFDDQFEQAIIANGGIASTLEIPANIGQQLDFAFEFEGLLVAVEVEKTNREKILRDLLKAHMYLSFGADLVLIALPRNYPHSHGIWNLFDFGVRRYDECVRYQFGADELLGRVAIVGFDQFDTETDRLIDGDWRNNVRELALRNPRNQG